jgi:hypothetical protein
VCRCVLRQIQNHSFAGCVVGCHCVWWVITLGGVIRLAEEGGGISKLENHLLKLARKEKKENHRLGSWRLTSLLASMQTTAGVAKGVSRFSGT